MPPGELALVQVFLHLPEQAKRASFLASAISQEVLSGLANDDTSNPEVQRDIAISRVRIGDVLIKQNKLDDALNEYQPAADAEEQVVKVQPNEPTYRSNLSRVYNDLGYVYARQNDLPKAKSFYEKSLDIRHNLARDDPSNNAWLEALAHQYARVGDTLAKLKDSPGAITNYQSSEKVWDILVHRMPSNLVWTRHSAEVRQTLVSELLSQGGGAAISKKDLLENAQGALDLRQRVAQSSPDSVLQQRELAVAHVGLGDVYKAIDEKAEALKQYQDRTTYHRRFH